MLYRQEHRQPRIAIIGAGISGLAAAHTFKDAGIEAVLYERQPVAGGRAKTGRKSGYIYDYGAQCLNGEAPDILATLLQRFPVVDQIEIESPIWIFDRLNHIQEGDPQKNAQRRIGYSDGLSSLIAAMEKHIHIIYETTISHIERDTCWNIYDKYDNAHGSFDTILISIPAPQARDLIMNSDFVDMQYQSKIAGHLNRSVYDSSLTFVFGYPTQLRERPYYALVNTDKNHAISWLAWEHKKSATRAPHERSLLIAQMAPQYSQEHTNVPDGSQRDVFVDVTHRISELIGEELPPPELQESFMWRFALPSTLADAQALNKISMTRGLAFCGDSYVGGRLHLAYEHGTIVAHQIIDAYYS